MPEHGLYLIEKLIFRTTSLPVKDQNIVKITLCLYSKELIFVSIKIRDGRYSEFLLVMGIILFYFSIFNFWGFFDINLNIKYWLPIIEMHKLYHTKPYYSDITYTLMT